MWKGNIERWAEMFSLGRPRFLLGPATYSGDWPGWKELLNQHLDRIVGVYARDEESAKTLRSTCRKPDRVGMDMDPAFTLQDWCRIERLREYSSKDHALIALRADHEAQSRFTNWRRSWCGKLPLIQGLIYRAVMRERRSRIRGICRNINSKIIVEDVAEKNFSYFCDRVNAAGVIYTDRLHTALLGLLLGKDVRVIETAYGKIRAVMELGRETIKQGTLTFIDG